MDDARVFQQAKQAFDTCIKAFDDRNWTYDRDDENMVIKCTVNGKDLPIEFIININSEMMIIQLFSKLPCTMKKDKLVEGAVAASYVTNKLFEGSFDYDMNCGKFYFRATSSYRNSLISKELVEYLIDVSMAIIDDYNDKFFALSLDVITLEQFFDAVDNN